METLGSLQKDKIIDLILKDPNHIYVYNSTGRKDGDYTTKQVYEAFKDDEYWYAVHEDICVRFYEQHAKQQCKKDRKDALVMLAHYILKHHWCFGSLENRASIGIYGGFARSALRAYLICKKSIYIHFYCAAKGIDILKILQFS